MLIEEPVDWGMQNPGEHLFVDLRGNADREGLSKHPAADPNACAERNPEKCTQQVGPTGDLRIDSNCIRPSCKHQIAEQVQEDGHGEKNSAATEVAPTPNAAILLDHLNSWPALELILPELDLPSGVLLILSTPQRWAGLAGGRHLPALLGLLHVAALETAVGLRLHQLLRLALFFDHASFQYHATVKEAQTLGIGLQHHKTCPRAHERPADQPFKDDLARRRIHSGEGIIYHHQLRFPVVCRPRHSDTGPLATGERDAPTAYSDIVAAREDLQVLFKRCRRQSLLVASLLKGLPEKYILLERALSDVRNLGAIGDYLGAAEASLADGHRLELAQDSLEECALARTHGAQDPHQLATRQVEMETAQCWRPGVILAPAVGAMQVQLCLHPCNSQRHRTASLHRPLGERHPWPELRPGGCPLGQKGGLLQFEETLHSLNAGRNQDHAGSGTSEDLA
mmetsp:Transcript_125973/g.268785  ORF Transcript_125973/g.268785 Transcript_125973/m.268785 type:complete len:454 (-) Transcript_125973:1532-2893(-)